MRRVISFLIFLAFLSTLLFIVPPNKPVQAAVECSFTVTPTQVPRDGTFSVGIKSYVGTREEGKTDKYVIHFSYTVGGLPGGDEDYGKYTEVDVPRVYLENSGDEVTTPSIKNVPFEASKIGLPNPEYLFYVNVYRKTGTGHFSHCPTPDRASGSKVVTVSVGNPTNACIISLSSGRGKTGEEIVTTIGNVTQGNKYKITVKNSKNEKVDEKTQTAAFGGKLETPFLFEYAGTYHFYAKNDSTNTNCAQGAIVSIRISGDPTPLEYKPITSFSTIADILTGKKFESVGALITALVPSIFSIAAMLALLFLIWGGIRYMTARGDPKAMDAAKGTITSAIIGLIIVLLAGVIYTLIAAVFKIDIFAILVPAAYAQSEPKDIGCVLKLGDECISTVFPSFGALFTNIVMFALATAALIFFVMLLWGGFRYLNAGGDPKNAEAARQTLTNAAIGLLIVVISLVIIEIVTRIAGIGSIFTP